MSQYTRVVFKHETADDLLNSQLWKDILATFLKGAPLEAIEIGEAGDDADWEGGPGEEE